MAEDSMQKQALIDYIQSLVGDYRTTRREVISKPGSLNHLSEMQDLADKAHAILSTKNYPEALLELSHKVKLQQLNYSIEKGIHLDKPVNPEEHHYFYNLKLVENKLNQLMQSYAEERYQALETGVRELEDMQASMKPEFIFQKLNEYLREVGKIQEYYKNMSLSKDGQDHSSLLNKLDILRDEILSFRSKLQPQLEQVKAPQVGLFQPGPISSMPADSSQDVQGEVGNIPSGPTPK